MNKPKDSAYWRNQRILEYKSRLQRSNKGCPWPAQVIALIKAAQSSSIKDNAVVNQFKRQHGLTDEDIMALLSSFERSAWWEENSKKPLSKLTKMVLNSSCE